MTAVTFTVPGTPIGKGRPRIGRGKGGHAMAFTPAKTANYESLIAVSAHNAMNGREPLSSPVSVTLVIECPVPTSWSKKKQGLALAGVVRPGGKPDADNVIKAVFDGMNNVVWTDDSLVCELHMTKRYSTTPCVQVTVISIPGAIYEASRSSVLRSAPNRRPRRPVPLDYL